MHVEIGKWENERMRENNVIIVYDLLDIYKIKQIWEIETWNIYIYIHIYQYIKIEK